jgi:hypothetical protein
MSSRGKYEQGRKKKKEVNVKEKDRNRAKMESRRL